MSQRIPTRLRSRASALLAAVALVAGFGVVSAPASASESGWLHTDGARIVTEAGEAHTIRAVSWLGLETSNCAPHGLWTISLDEGLQTIAGLGFNAIRLPYANECLTASSTSSIDANANPDLVGLTPLQVMDAVIDRASAYGLDVILDRHRPTTSGQSSLWYTSEVDEQQWIDDWVMLAERYADDPTVIGADLHNEPHDSACWGCGDASVDWPAAATRAGNAVLAANPNLLIIVEGVGRDVDGSWTWWGGGLRGVADDPVVLEVADRVVYSPHDYPASVAWQNWFGASDYPDNLTSVWDTNWGYIQKQGIAPVLLGEFGTKLETDSDRLWFDEIIAYLDENDMSFAFWSFNPNSGDTGGIVADDWRTPEADKVAALAPLLAQSVGPVPTPTVSPSTTATPTPTPTPTLTPTPTPTPTPTLTPMPAPTPTVTPSPAALSGSLEPTSVWGQGYVANVVVTAASHQSGWTASWTSPTATGIVNAWGMDCSLAGSTITCDGAGWAASLSPGQTMTVGLQVAATSAPTVSSFTLAPH